MNHAFGASRLIAVAAGTLFGLVVQAQTLGAAPSAVKPPAATATPLRPQAPSSVRPTPETVPVRVLSDASGGVVTVPMARARWAGQAALPHDTPFNVPTDAGAEFASSGKFAFSEPLAADPPGARPAYSPLSPPSAPRATGAALPFKGQIVQGVAGLVPLKRDEFLVLSDNGFDTLKASRDVLLAVHRMRPNWETGLIERRESLLLRDPAQVLPFPLAPAAGKARYLTGADLSPRSLQVVGNELWIGDDRGPYIVRFDMKGKALGWIETTLRSHTYRSADHPVFTAGNGVAESSAEVQPGGGLHAMALSIDGSRLYPVLARPLIDPTSREPERVKGSPVVRILEVNAQSREYTGRYLRYPLEQPDHVVSDFQMISATSGLIIEHDDNSEGVEPSCAGLERNDCHTQPARFKRLVKIDLSKLGPERVVRKVAYVDLTQIEHPNGPIFSLPHRRPSALAVVNPTHVVIANDHNAPFASSREIGRPDATEFTRLDLTDLIEIP